MKNRICIFSKVSSLRFSLTTKRKITALQQTNPTDTTWIKRWKPTSSIRHTDIMNPISFSEKDTLSFLWYSCQKYLTPQSNHEKTSDKQKLRDILQNNWSILLKSVKVMKDRTETYYRWQKKKTKCNMGWSQTESWKRKGHRWENW